MKFIIPIVLLVLFTGCTKTVPIATKYKISTSLDLNKIANLKNSTCKTQSLKVMQSFSSGLLMSKEMYYVVDSNKIYPYAEAKWATTPNRVVSDAYFRMLRDLNIFKSIQNSKSRTKATWLLETRVEDFMQYYTDDNSRSYVIVSINLIIFDSASSKVIATKVFKSKVDVDTLDANGGVKALDKALSKVLSSSASWLSKECK